MKTIAATIRCVILSAFAPCIQQGANANNIQDATMNTAKKIVLPPIGYVNLTSEQASRFWGKVIKSKSKNDCWIWSASLHKDGYGNIGILGKSYLAHRISWMIANGPIPKGLQVLHNCPSGDNPACVRPSHLFLGTQADNILDMERKGRDYHPSGDDHGARKHPESRPRGEASGLAKLTDKKVVEIRRLHAGGLYSFRKLARMYSVDRATIKCAVRRETWRHV